MKTIIRKIGVLAVMLQAFLAASAYDFEVDGIYYNVVSIQDLTCEVTKGDNKYEGEIVIPSMVEYKSRKLTVVQIGSSAFSGCYGLTSVVFPANLTTIGSYAFSGCDGLTSVVFPASLTTIGSYAFSGCDGLTSVAFSDGLTTIGSKVFYGCKNLTSVAFPEGLTTIESEAFYDCSGLTSVAFPASLTTIESRAFYDCSGLTSVVFPASLTTIGWHAFAYCSGLTSVVFPASLTKIGSYAFYACNGLTSVKFEESAMQVNIEKYAFEGCRNLEYVILPSLCKMLDTYYTRYAECYFFYDKLKYLKVGNLGCLGEEDKIIFSSGKIETMELDNVVWVNHSSVASMAYPYKIRDIQVENLIFTEKYCAEKPEFMGYYKIRSYEFDLSDLKKLVSKSLEPPVIPGEVSNKILMNAEVEVPIQALEKYQQAPVWKDFWNLKGVEGLVGIEESEGITAKEIGRYDLTGKAVGEDYRGIVIIRYSDGSTSKTIQR